MGEMLTPEPHIWFIFISTSSERAPKDANWKLKFDFFQKHFNFWTTHLIFTIYISLGKYVLTHKTIYGIWHLLSVQTRSWNLVFEKKGVIRSSAELIEGINILSAAVNFDNSERFSEYHVKGQASSVVGNVNDNTKGKGLAKDNGISRYRPLLVLAENSADTDGSQKRANWEASFRTAKSMQVNVKG